MLTPSIHKTRFILLSYLFVFIYVSSAFAKTVISGTITASQTWNAAGSPYEVGNTTVNANATITVEPGTTVQFLDYSVLVVHGRMVATGTSAQKITFTSSSGATEGNPWQAIRLTNADGVGNGLGSHAFTHCTFEGGGYWYGTMLEATGGSQVSVDNCVFRHSISGAVSFHENAGGPITNTRFENNAGYSLWLRGSSPVVDGCVFSGNGEIGRLESGGGKGSFPAFKRTTFLDSGRVHIATNIDSSGTLSAAPYYIDSHRVAAADATVTVEGGSSFAFADYAVWTVHGNLIANGTAAAPILFTSISGVSEGAPWQALRLTNNDGNGDKKASRLSYCTLEGGGYWYATLLEVSGGAPVTVDHCAFRGSTADGIRFYENSGGAITNTSFENNAGYGLWLRGSSPLVDSCAFTGNGQIGRLESGDGKGSFPAFTKTVFTNSGRVHIASNIDSGGTLSAAPYYIDSHRVAAAEATITIEGGSSFTFADYAAWTVHGNLIGNGTEAAPILFTSVSGAGEGNPWQALRLTNNEGEGARKPSRLSYCTLEGGGYWYATLLEVYGGMPLSLDHCTFRKSTADGVRFFEDSGGPVTNTRFESNAGYGLWLRGTSPVVDQCVFSANGNVGRLESGAGKGSFPVFTDTTFSNSGYVHIATNIDSAGTLTAAPYYIDSHRVAAAGATITIEGGASFTFADYAAWTVHGNLIANGTERASILFTSISGAATGNPWQALRLTNNEGEGNALPSALSYCTFEGGGYWYGTLLEVYGRAPVTLDHCHFRLSSADGVRFGERSGGSIRNCVFEDIASYGLRLQSTSPAISGSTFRNCGSQAILLLSNEANGSSLPAFADNVFGPDDFIEIGSNFHSGGHLSNPGQAYFLSGTKTILSAADISVAPGTVFKFAAYTALVVDGSLNASGTGAQKIIFTSDDELKARDQWSSLAFTGARSKASTLKNCVFEAGGYWYGTLVEIAGTSRVTIDQCILRNCQGDGLQILSGTDVSVTFTTVSDCSRNGIYVEQADPRIEGCAIYGNDGSAIYTSSASSVVNNCYLRDNGSAGVWAMGNRVPNVSNAFISGNAGFGIQNQTGTELLAINNWWGDPSGPYHATTNPQGKGNKVSDRVVFDPYRVFAAGIPQELQATLVNGVPVSGTFPQGVSGYYYAVDVPRGKNLTLSIDDLSDEGVTQVYLSRDRYPTTEDYQYRHESNGADQRLFVGAAGPGRWYVLVFQFTGEEASAFTIRADLADISLFSVAPKRHANTVPITLTLDGAGFGAGAAVELIGSGGGVIRAVETQVESYYQVKATLQPSSLVAGVYDVRVTQPGKAAATLSKAFTALQGGNPKLVTNLVVPSVVGYHQIATLYVEYENQGEVAMPAPILLVDAEQNGRHAALITLDRDRVASGFWTSAIPEGFENSLQILGSGKQAGVLQPGESMRVPVYYAGWQKPWDFAYPPIQFSLAQMDPDATALVDWGAMKEGVKPDGMSAELFEALWANVQGMMGATWGDYVTALSENARYLETIGRRTEDVRELLAFELQQADAVNARSPLGEAMDLAVNAPGMDMVFSRQFYHGVSGRFRLGTLGRGWTHRWEMVLMERADGTVTVEHGPGRRVFQPDVRGGYTALPGDRGKLTKSASGFLLVEPEGERMAFNGNGGLDYLEDSNGIRVTCQYASGRLSGLLHSKGPSVTFTYNANGRLATVFHQALGTITYTYDAGGEHLASVTYPDGRKVLYNYETSAIGARRHALLSMTVGSQRAVFAYDVFGRLQSYHPGDPAQLSTYSYPTTGTINITDPVGNVSQVSLNENAGLERLRNGEGHQVDFDYDVLYHGLSRMTLPDGQSYSLSYDHNGNLASFEDPGGSLTTIKSSASGQVQEVLDANGNRTRYTHDAKGNTTAIDRADGSRDAFEVDASGEISRWTNRRQQTVSFSRDSNGRLTKLQTNDDGQSTFSYDARGNLLAAENANGRVSFEYGSGALPVKVTYPGGRYLEYTYNTDGQRTALRDHTGRATLYHYDNLGRLDRVTDQTGALVAAYRFTAAGKLAQRDLGNGISTVFNYDRAGQLIRLVTKQANGPIVYESTATRNALGMPETMTTPEGEWYYEYDQTGRLTRAEFKSSQGSVPSVDLRYFYDAMGNRTEIRVNGSTSTYSVNPMNQYASNGDSAFTYDADGNLTNESQIEGNRQYAYDVEGRLVSIVSGSETMQFLYDALGNRIASIENGVRTDYLVDPLRGGNVVAEFTSGNVLSNRYHYGVGMEAREVAGGTHQYYTFDANGSVSSLCDQSGAALNTYRFRPFGEALYKNEAVTNPYQFCARTGTRAEADGLYWMHARYYRSDLGRFLTEDVFFEGWNNSYTYASNNPVMFHDPTGELQKPISDLTEEEAEFGYWRDYFNSGKGKTLAAGAVATYSSGIFYSFLGSAATGYGVYLVSASGPIGWGVGATLFIANGAYQVYDSYNTAQAIKTALNERKESLRVFRLLQAKDLKAYEKLVGGRDLKKLMEKNPKEFFKLLHDAVQKLAQSSDPNQKLGPAGYGEANYVASGSLLPYRVDFENDAKASAPAQVVVVTDPLSTNLDWSTFELTEVGFGGRLFPVDRYSRGFHYTESMSYLDKELDVEINVSFDPIKGRITTVFSTTDAETGLPPEVQYGFLPPEDGTGRGQGYFAYTVRAKNELATGTEIRNVATITFDFGEVIDTNQVDPHDPGKGTDPAKEAAVTIDATRPSSRVAVLSATNATSFPVRWSGEDSAGAGVGLYSIYVKDGNGPFTLWLENTALTSTTFQGLNGHTYHFYSIARDLVGNEELGKSVAEATTTISGGIDPYQGWLSEHFSSAEIQAGLLTARDADADGDGRTNAEEYAFVSDPRLADVAALTAARVGVGFMVDYWRRPVGFVYRMIGSSDLVTWVEEKNVTETVIATAGDAEKVRAVISQGAALQRYYRVRATD